MNKRIIAFSQVTRCGGVTINSLLQGYYGLRHFDLVGNFLNNEMTYTEKDLFYDMKIHPFARSFAGHFSSNLDIAKIGRINNKEIDFYTMLRDPIDRVFSKYRFQVDRYNLPNDFIAWFKKYHVPNGMVHHFTGSDNLELAKDILMNKYKAVGILERFDESLLIFKKKLSLDGMDLNYKVKNDTIKLKSEKHRIVKSEFEDLVMSSNLKDRELYNFVLTNIWNEQIRDYNSDKLAIDLMSEFDKKRDRSEVRVSTMINRGMNKCYHHFFYKPLAKLR